MGSVRTRKLILPLGVLFLCIAVHGCKLLNSLLPKTKPIVQCFDCGDDGTRKPPQCPVKDGDPWVPNVQGVGNENRVVTGLSFVSKDYRTQGSIVGMSQGSLGREIRVTFSVGDIGPRGSLTLEAIADTSTSNVSPMLVELKYGTRKFINLDASCVSSGLYQCSNGNAGDCTYKSSCAIVAPTQGVLDSMSQFGFLTATAQDRYRSRLLWEKAAINPLGNLSSMTFPTALPGDGKPFGSEEANAPLFFEGGSGDRLPSGTYQATYILQSQSELVPSSRAAVALKLRVIERRDLRVDPRQGGAIDLNVVLVGQENVLASRTLKGQQNLNALLRGVVQRFSDQQSDAAYKINIGEVQVFEWGCEEGGNVHSTISVGALGGFLKSASLFLGNASNSKALNLLLINNFANDAKLGTLVGAAGGIPVFTQAGTNASGLAFSTYGVLDQYNDRCSGDPLEECAENNQDEMFWNISDTVAHELGHALRLSHPSEGTGDRHDEFADTPICTDKDPETGSISTQSCVNLADNSSNPALCNARNCADGNCPQEVACQFNHVMWWSYRRFRDGASDGSFISKQSAKTMNLSPFVF